jgi:hypothetical protein
MKIEIHLPYDDATSYDHMVQVMEVIAEKEGVRLMKMAFAPVNLEVALVVVTPEVHGNGHMAQRYWKVSADVYKPEERT